MTANENTEVHTEDLSEDEVARRRKEEFQRRREERLRKEEEDEKRDQEERAKREEERATRRSLRDTRMKQKEIDTKKEVEEIEKRNKKDEERRKKKADREARWLLEEQAAKEAEEKRRQEREARRLAELQAEEDLRQKKRELEESERHRIEELLEAEEDEEDKNIRLERKRRRSAIEGILSKISSKGEFTSPDESEREKQILWFLDRIVEQDQLREEMQNLVSEDYRPVTEVLAKPAFIIVLIKCITDTRDGGRLHEHRGELIKGHTEIVVSPEASPVPSRPSPGSSSPSLSGSGEYLATIPSSTLAMMLARIEFCLNLLTEGALPVARIVSVTENHFLIDTLFQMLKDNHPKLPPPNSHLFMKVASSFMNRRPSELSDFYLKRSTATVEYLVRHIGSPEITELVWKMIETEVMLKSEGLYVSEEAEDDEHMGSPNPNRVVGNRRIDEGSPTWSDKLIGGFTTKLQDMLDKWEEFGQRQASSEEIDEWAQYSGDEVENMMQICIDILNKQPRTRMARSILGHSFNNALVQLAFNIHPPVAPLSGHLLTLIDLLLAQILKKQLPPPPAMGSTSDANLMQKPAYKAPGLVLSMISPLANPDSSKSPLQVMAQWLAVAPDAPVPIPRPAAPTSSSAPRSPYVSLPVSKIATPSTAPPSPSPSPAPAAPSSTPAPSRSVAPSPAPAPAVPTPVRTAKSMRSPTPTPMDRGTNTPSTQRGLSTPSRGSTPSSSSSNRVYLNTPSLSIPSRAGAAPAPSSTPARSRPSPSPSPLSSSTTVNAHAPQHSASSSGLSTPVKSAPSSTAYPTTPTQSPPRTTSSSSSSSNITSSNNTDSQFNSSTHVTRIVGVQRLRALQCIGSLTKLEWDNVNVEGRLASSGALKSAIRMFFEFPNSTPVHTLVADMVRALIKRCMATEPSSPAAMRLLEHILKDCGLVSGILSVLKGTAEAQQDEEEDGWGDLPVEEYNDVYLCQCAGTPCVCTPENNKGSKVDAEVIAPMLIAASPKPVSKPAPESMPHIMAICQDLTRAALRRRWLLLIVKDCSGEDQWLDLVVLQKGLVFSATPENNGWKSSPRPNLTRQPSKLKFVIPTPKVDS